MSLLVGLARHLAALGHGVWSSTAPYTTGQTGIVVDHLPAAPDDVVVLTTYAGGEADGRLPFDEAAVQVRVRGSTVSTTVRDRAQAIYGALHGVTRLTLPNGIIVVNLVCPQGGPIDMGVDANNRHEHAVNFRVEYHAPTPPRPAL